MTTSFERAAERNVLVTKLARGINAPEVSSAMSTTSIVRFGQGLFVDGQSSQGCPACICAALEERR